MFRFQTSADSISYLDMSDAVMPGGNWHRLINGTWSPLYPFLFGLFRRVFNISPAHEIIAGHLLNIVFFVAAFLCFEYFLASLMRRAGFSGAVSGSGMVAFPAWAFIALTYSLFIWSSIFAIELRYLRPDMLMSCFLYLAAAQLLNMGGGSAQWSAYLWLGVVLGVGFLAKEPMLPISIVILAASLFVVRDWRPAVKMAVAAFVVILCIGTLYFVPLSLSRGKITFGESGSYNYLVNIDRAGPGKGWYLESPGHGSGQPTHPPARIFSSPPAYAFSYSLPVTHPLRFDPSWWMAGMHPRIAIKRQIGETYSNFFDLCRPLAELLVFLAGLIWIARSVPKQRFFEQFRRVWPVVLIGVLGCAMYVVVHVEARYVGAFLTLFFCAALSCFPEIRRKYAGKIIAIATIVIVASLLVPDSVRLDSKYYQQIWSPNEDALAVRKLYQLGVQPGDHVGRISQYLTDLTIERIGRIEVVDEVDFMHAREFWSSPIETQHEILQALADHGAKVVIATKPEFGDDSRSEWRQLDTTDYWVWFPGQAAHSGH